ncbi:MAG: M48 family metallopeptidase [Actinobacteria bacterium]|jgi:predicted metal-dependent hydrolase|nr:MAG: M48 family metallopeptidase [Actinomycetota bacterium]
MQVEVVRSSRRRRTVQARQLGEVVRVTIPATMTKAEEDRWVAEMLRRIERHQHTADVDLMQRALDLARGHGLPVPKEVRWVDNQRFRWGSCTPVDGTIRISSRLAGFPDWVLDYVLMHELAHLEVPHHDRRFWELVERYPLSERARGYLLAKETEATA